MMEYDKYPAGQYKKPDQIDSESVLPQIQKLAEFPQKVRAMVTPLSPAQLNTKTLPGFWTVEQIIHHLADSHANGLFRTKLALTESTPQIKPYDEKKWAELPDGKNFPISVSLALLEGIHQKWSHLFRSLDDSGLQKTYFHPEDNAYVPLGEQVFMYVYHGNHHLGFIQQLIDHNKWNS